jgi:hypothetical protein
LQTDGTITCWGNEYYPAPTGTFIALSAGSGYACAVRTDNTLFCWGGDTFGETSPPQVPSLLSALAGTLPAA